MNYKSKWSDYCVREVMTKSNNTVIRKLLDTNSSEYLAFRKLPDTYHSIKRYQLEALTVSSDRLWELDSVTSWFIDIDGHFNGITTTMLIRATVRMCAGLQNILELSDDEIFLWWSGRGFHIGIPGEVLFSVPTSGQENNFKGLARWAQKEFNVTAPLKTWDALAHDFKSLNLGVVDTSIYTARSLIRIPGTKNSKSRFSKDLPKVRIPVENFRLLANSGNTIDMVKKLELIATGNFWSDEVWV